jgi:hypothetical protein
MKLKIVEKTFKEIEIDLPYYTTNGLHFFKFDKNQDCICVSKTSVNGFVIQKHPKSQTPDEWYLFPQITKEEFEAKFNELLKIIQDEIKN